MSLYKMNGTPLLLDPTTGRWVERQSVGVDGLGRHIYAPLRSYELRWDLIDQASFVQLIDFFEGIGATGSVVAELPKWRSATGGFFAYTGCHITEPTQAEYFETYPMSATVLVTGIRV